MAQRVYDRAYASFRVFGPTLDPMMVSLALRLPADHVHRNGEPRLTRSKNGKVIEYAPYRFGLWSMSSEQWVNSPRLSVHLEWLLDQLEPLAEKLHVFRQPEVRMDFFCFSSGTSPNPPSLPKFIRVRAGALGIEIVIDHYAST